MYKTMLIPFYMLTAVLAIPQAPETTPGFEQGTVVSFLQYLLALYQESPPGSCPNTPQDPVSTESVPDVPVSTESVPVSTESVPTGGEGSECTFDSDCGSGLVCFWVSSTTVPESETPQETDIPVLPNSVEGSECFSDTDCGGNLVCVFSEPPTEEPPTEEPPTEEPPTEEPPTEEPPTEEPTTEEPNFEEEWTTLRRLKRRIKRRLRWLRQRLRRRRRNGGTSPSPEPTTEPTTEAPVNTTGIPITSGNVATLTYFDDTVFECIGSATPPENALAVNPLLLGYTAEDYQQMNQNGETPPWCGKTVSLTVNGQTWTGTVIDTCNPLDGQGFPDPATGVLIGTKCDYDDVLDVYGENGRNWLIENVDDDFFGPSGQVQWSIY